jgi:hypothetical protein
MRAVKTPDATAGGPASPVPRQTKVVLSQVQPWSVFKFSLLFYFCLMLVFLFAMVILYWVLSVIGVLDSLSSVLDNLFGAGQGRFEIHGYWLLSRTFLFGIVGVVVWSLVNLFVALLFNLVADVVGGIQITLTERR